MRWLVIIIFTISFICAFKPNAVFAEDGNCKEPMSNMEMTICAGKDLEASDRELNTVYRQTLAQNRRLAVLIRDTQRAWIIYRDKECAITAEEWRGGTGQTLAVVTCKSEMTKARIRELRTRMPR